MAYILRTPAGTFTIEPDEADWEMFKLCIGGLWLASFQTAEEASTASDKAPDGLVGLGPPGGRRMPGLPCRMGGMLNADERSG